MSSTQPEPVALNGYYPCCGIVARFSRVEKNMGTVVRHCPKCHTAYLVHRGFGNEEPHGRLDTLTWEVTTHGTDRGAA